ncbi:VOC family protein [Micromonospora sp. NBC_00898]|uniref:VOC family protein n=1 Tax=Micromonospora sp. NBC_00898 TaxID=2975981 RepID=UPI0038649733|nr:VOC family protein [Micromonospora sp. NBC_00898]
MSNIYPVFRYPNARAAVEFLRTAFGLTVQEVHEGPDGEVRHAQLRYGDDLIMLAPGAGPSARPTDDDHRIYVVVDDIDAHHERAAAAGAEIVVKPFDTDYGSRDYTARDLIGNVWSFGTYRP